MADGFEKLQELSVEISNKLWIFILNLAGWPSVSDFFMLKVWFVFKIKDWHYAG